MKKWTIEEEQFLRTNWTIMTIKELAEKLGRTKAAVANKAENMGLPRKKHWVSSKQIGGYSLSPESALELEGRKKTIEFSFSKETMSIEDILKIKVRETQKTSRVKTGKIIQKNDNFIALKFDKYVECFTYSDFLTGEVLVV